MLGKASEIKVELLVEYYGRTIEDEIVMFLEKNPTVEVIDIKFTMVPELENTSSVYHEALVIYKEAAANA